MALSETLAAAARTTALDDLADLVTRLQAWVRALPLGSEERLTNSDNMADACLLAQHITCGQYRAACDLIRSMDSDFRATIPATVIAFLAIVDL